MALTQGYYNIMYPTVLESIRQSEEKSLQLVNASQGLSKEKFSEALNQNAVKIFDDWTTLYKKLLAKYNGGAGVRYEKLPTPDTPTKYEGNNGAENGKFFPTNSSRES